MVSLFRTDQPRHLGQKVPGISHPDDKGGPMGPPIFRTTWIALLHDGKAMPTRYPPSKTLICAYQKKVSP